MNSSRLSNPCNDAVLWHEKVCLFWRSSNRGFLFDSVYRTLVGEEMTVCDVLVIGAGPGGGNAALQCSRKGSTIIIEDHPEIGTPVHCGECISEIACQNLELTLLRR